MTATNSKPLDLAQFEGHTPGPWESLQDSASYRVEPVKGAVSVCNSYHESQNAGLGEGEGEANSLLLAAAPALLAECKRQREQIKALREQVKALRGIIGHEKSLLQVPEIETTP